MRILPDGIKVSIADIVRHFEFTGRDCGTCVPRAMIADSVFRTLGITSRMVAGGLLVRVGYDVDRDTLRFALPNNLGGYYRDTLIGHVWNEVGGEIADFSSGDWVAESHGCAVNDMGDQVFGDVAWEVEPPPFIWESARSLKNRWKPRGNPRLGDTWYGGWQGTRQPDYASHDAVVTKSAPHIETWIEELHLRGRIAAFREGLEYGAAA
jgi:hypothetical protein